jgi:hypothetical protein
MPGVSMRCVPVGDGSPSSACTVPWRVHGSGRARQRVGKARSRWEVTVPLKASSFRATFTGLGLGT